MRDTTDIEAQQIRIYPMDSLPLGRLASPAVSAAFREMFGWTKAEAAEEGGIGFGPGFFAGPDGADSITIKSFQLNDRRLILTVVGETRMAHRAYDAMLHFFVESTGWKPVDPVVVTEQTACVTTLDFDWLDLMSPAVARFVQGPLLEAASLASPAPAVVRGMSFQLRVAYSGAPQEISAHGITLSDKRVVVEPRVNTPFADRRYFTLSPTDSETHLRLVAQLEKDVIAGREGAISAGSTQRKRRSPR
jgi:hypothetical protein